MYLPTKHVCILLHNRDKKEAWRLIALLPSSVPGRKKKKKGEGAILFNFISNWAANFQIQHDILFIQGRQSLEWSHAEVADHMTWLG